MDKAPGSEQVVKLINLKIMGLSLEDATRLIVENGGYVRDLIVDPGPKDPFDPKRANVLIERGVVTLFFVGLSHVHRQQNRFCEHHDADASLGMVPHGHRFLLDRFEGVLGHDAVH